MHLIQCGKPLFDLQNVRNIFLKMLPRMVVARDWIVGKWLEGTQKVSAKQDNKF